MTVLTKVAIHPYTCTCLQSSSNDTERHEHVSVQNWTHF